MNRNIEVINENLWVVNFDYVKMGYIKELSFPSNSGSDYGSLTDDGKLIVNSSIDHYQDVIAYMTVIMQIPDELLESIHGFYSFMKLMVPKSEGFSDDEMEAFIQRMKLHETKKTYFNLAELEKKRRSIQREYIKGRRKPFGIYVITKIFKRKKVKDIGKYK